MHAILLTIILLRRFLIMEEQAKTKRIRRVITKEEKIAALQTKIDFHKKKIEELCEQIEELKEPSISIKDITSRIKELDLPLNDVLKAVEKLSKK
jgi:septal ring factor EnvC (AmiA/AmiB activator)